MAADRTRELGAVGNSGGEYEGRFWGGGGFYERSSATSIGAAYGRLFRLRKTAMLSRHWRLWLSFPSSPDPFSRRAAGNRLVRSFGLARPCEVGAFSCFGVEVTAALSSAVTSTKFIRYAPTHRRNHPCRSSQLKRQPLFGRRGLEMRGKTAIAASGG